MQDRHVSTITRHQHHRVGHGPGTGKLLHVTPIEYLLRPSFTGCSEETVDAGAMMRARYGPARDLPKPAGCQSTAAGLTACFHPIKTRKKRPTDFWYRPSPVS